jgi:hypothetical protein
VVVQPAGHVHRPRSRLARRRPPGRTRRPATRHLFVGIDVVLDQVGSRAVLEGRRVAVHLDRLERRDEFATSDPTRLGEAADHRLGAHEPALSVFGEFRGIGSGFHRGPERVEEGLVRGCDCLNVVRLDLIGLVDRVSGRRPRSPGRPRTASAGLPSPVVVQAARARLPAKVSGCRSRELLCETRRQLVVAPFAARRLPSSPDAGRRAQRLPGPGGPPASGPGLTSGSHGRTAGPIGPGVSGAELGRFRAACGVRSEPRAHAAVPPWDARQRPSWRPPLSRNRRQRSRDGSWIRRGETT